MSYFHLNSLDYNTTNVFLMAKKIKITDNRFRLDFGFKYVEKFPLSGFEIFVIVFFIVLFIMALALVAVLYANREGYIDIYIPKKFRKYCVKDQAVEEQKEVEEHAKQIKKVAEDSNSLKYRLGIDPTRNGFIIHDDMFID
jgi:uncharacterized membrane protein (UPF0182 family)